MQYTINELRQKIFSQVYEVYEIFQNFFEPQFVDLQNLPTDRDLMYALATWEIEPQAGGYEISDSRFRSIKNSYSSLKPFILVWWPSVTVTNENDRSVVIQDLYAKIELTIEGRIPYECRGFQLNRTTFPEIQFTSGYLHSHIPHFTGIPGFANPCLGSGPINNTILDLKNGYEETLWMLFCRELSLYVIVESLRGGPYFRMEQIGSEKLLYGYQDYSFTYKVFNSLSNFWPHRNLEKKALFREILRQFALYYLQYGHLSLNYKDGQFVSGMTYFDYMVDVSNSFIGFFNKYGHREDVDGLYDMHILVKALAANNKFYESTAVLDGHDYSQFEGQEMFLFKGEMKHLHIEQDTETHLEVTLLLNHKIAMFILYNILKIINYRYRNEYSNKYTRGISAEAAPTYQTVFYL